MIWYDVVKINALANRRRCLRKEEHTVGILVFPILLRNPRNNAHQTLRLGMSCRIRQRSSVTLGWDSFRTGAGRGSVQRRCSLVGGRGIVSIIMTVA